MKKLILAAGCMLMITGCSNHTEQIDVVKSHMKTNYQMPDEEISSYKFEADEAEDKDAYKHIANNYTKQYHKYEKAHPDIAELALTKAANYNTLAENASKKTFYIVEAYSTDGGDTIHKKIFYIDDKNAIIDISNLK